MKIITLLALLVSLISCSSDMKQIDYSLFKSTGTYYKNKKDDLTRSQLEKIQGQKVIASFRKQALTDFSIWFTNTFEKGIVFEESLRTKTISAEFHNATEKEIINIVSKMFDLESNRLGSTYYIGKFRQEDRGILVRQIQTLSIEDIEKVVQSVNANQGKVSVTETGVLVVADRESVLTRISDLFDSLDGVNIKKYVVNFYFIDLNVSELKRKGIDLTTSGTFSADLAVNNPELLAVENGLNLLSKNRNW